MAIARLASQRILERMEDRTSIGIAELQNPDNATSLVARADAALYEAKRQGRGRCVDSDSMMPKAIRGGA